MTTRYLGPTNFRGARISCSIRRHFPVTKTVTQIAHWDDRLGEAENHDAAAIEWAKGCDMFGSNVTVSVVGRAESWDARGYTYMLEVTYK